MRLPSLLRAGLPLAALVTGLLGACGLGVSGLGAAEAGPPETGVLETSAPDTGVFDVGASDSGVPDSSGTSGEAGTPEASCAGLACNGACVTGTDCRSCPGAPLLCASTGQCLADCQGCTDRQGAAMPIECFACDSSRQHPIGTCQYHDAGSFCLNGDYQGQYQGSPGYQCTCADVGECPGATQVCIPLGSAGQSFCLTCGETTVGAIDGQPCRDGGTCQEGQALCQ